MTAIESYDLDCLMALRYAYYVAHQTIVPDHVYDDMETRWRTTTGRTMPVGSEDPASYAPRHRALALYLLLAQKETHNAITSALPGEELL